MKSSALTPLIRAVSRFLHRFHLTLFVVFVLGGLSLVTLFLNHAIAKDDSSIAPPGQQPFDSATMKKIDELHTSSEQTDLTFPAGRTSPF